MGTYTTRYCALPGNLRPDLSTCTSCLPERHVALQEPGKRLQDVIAPQQWPEVGQRWRNIRQILRTLPYHGHGGKCASCFQAALDGDIVEELVKGVAVRCVGLSQLPCTGCSNPAMLSSKPFQAGLACHGPSRVRRGHTAAGPCARLESPERPQPHRRP